MFPPPAVWSHCISARTAHATALLISLTLFLAASGGISFDEFERAIRAETEQDGEILFGVGGGGHLLVTSPDSGGGGGGGGREGRGSRGGGDGGEGREGVGRAAGPALI